MRLHPRDLKHMRRHGALGHELLAGQGCSTQGMGVISSTCGRQSGQAGAWHAVMQWQMDSMALCSSMQGAIASQPWMVFALRMTAQAGQKQLLTSRWLACN